MQFLIASAFLFVLAASLTTLPAPRCPPDQVYLECDTNCNRSCKDFYPHAFCTGRCVSGCFCTGAGLVKDNFGNCVKVEDCPGFPYTCPTNEEWTCLYRCQEKCERISALERTKRPWPCPLYFACPGYGCQCVQGYCRNETGVCIPGF